jgi:hypothetical protein
MQVLLYFPSTEFSPRWSNAAITPLTFELTGWDCVNAQQHQGDGDVCYFCQSTHYVVYNVLIKLGRVHYVLLKRYSDFVVLRDELLREYPALQGESEKIPFPPKQCWATTSDEEFLFRRQQGLAKWLDSFLKLLSAKGMLKAGSHFFELPKKQ